MPQADLRGPEDSVKLDWPAVRAYLARHGMRLDKDPPPRQFAGGLANLNYLIHVDGAPAVLRRPPMGELPAGAYDMAREHRILSRLPDALAFVPRSLHLCDDPSVCGQRFQILEYKPGLVIREDIPPDLLIRPRLGERLSEVLLETIAAIHGVDTAAIGLDTLGRPDGFLARGVSGWVERGWAAKEDGTDLLHKEIGAWLEQLVAESTGKLGKGIIPVDRELLGKPDVYGSDRVFAYIRLEAAPDKKQDEAVSALEKAGHPVVRIAIDETFDIGEEFFRWEVATAVAGSILGINAFNQPDVEASKMATRKLTSEYEQTGSLPKEPPLHSEGDLALYTDEKNAIALRAAVGNRPTFAGFVKAHLDRLKAGDYFAVLGFIEMNGAHERALQTLRHAVRDKKRVATCLGFGPRFLHSTGQAYKGGPNSGVFLQITCEDATDLAVPGQRYTFGIVKAAQARGDFQVLAERDRRALRVHLGKDVAAGLAKLNAAITQALNS